MTDSADPRDNLYLNYIRAIGHDVGAPLRHIRGFSGLLEDEIGRELADEPRMLLSQIIRSAEIAEQMIYGVHDLAHLAQGVRANIIESLADLFRAGCRSCPQALSSLEIEGDTDLISDPRLLRNVAERLASNAALYADRPALRIEITADEATVQCHFTDPGPGLPAQELARAVRPFQR